uniref:Protein pellino n=1 Tax=Trichuris muris TaxID=70415 RepID=A0A5S6R3A0_TRIMR
MESPVLEKYGELIVLGYNGVNGSAKSSCRSKFELLKRRRPNGIAKADHYTVESSKRQAHCRDRMCHSVMYTLNRGETVIVEYAPDERTDMFQVGRSSEPQIDFTVMDTWLGRSFLNSGLENSEKSPQSTISRYACRILVERESPYLARVYAAGFDSCKNIFLGEKATKWRKESFELDGLTTNGILILHPQLNGACRQNGNNTSSPHRLFSNTHQFSWFEVSVDGDLYTLRPSRSSAQRGDKVDTVTNVLQDGTLIDLCGATLLYRTGDGISNSPNLQELERVLNRLNAGRPQCPVNLNTLVIPKQKTLLPLAPERQPYVYLNCGHVQGYHSWGHSSDSLTHQCPICKTMSSDIVQLCMGMEPAFHLDSGILDCAFIPCGHMASYRTVTYWSRISLPHGTNSFHPVCPFCTVLLSPKKPFVKLIFQDNCF